MTMDVVLEHREAGYYPANRTDGLGFMRGRL